MIQSRRGIAALCLAVSMSCACSRMGRPITATPAERFTVAATAYLGNCSVAVADANGYFASENLLVTVRKAPTGKDALADVLAGRADVATVADVPVMFAGLANQPIAVVATISTAAQDHGIVARRDRGIRSAGDLRRKRMGVPVGTSAHFFLDAFLNRHKLSPAQVTAVNLAPEQLADALQAGDVDAVSIWQPFVSDSAAGLGSDASVFYGEGVYDVMYNLAATTQGVSARRPTFEKFLRAVSRGAEFCRNESPSAQQVVARSTGMAAARVRDLWPAYTFRVGLAQALLLALEHEARWAIQNKLRTASSPPNYLNHLELGPLDAVSPAAVTVIH